MRGGSGPGRRWCVGSALVCAATLLAACHSQTSSAVESRTGDGLPAPAAVRRAGVPRIVALGDSLTAGLGLPASEAYPALLQSRLEREGYEVEVVNAGVSGDTSAGGLRRLAWSLEGDVRILIVALGANDGLRGLSIQQMRQNLAAIIEEAQSRDIQVLLTGMEALPNFGPDYTVRFREVYRDLAEQYDVAFVPFLLEGVAGVESLNQADGVHPNAEGAQRVADHLWPALEPLLRRVTTE